MKKELFALIDKVEIRNDVAVLEQLLNDVVQNLPEKNVEGRRLISIVNEFIGEVEEKKDKSKLVDKKSRLIKLILELEIKDLSIVEKIYNVCGYPFPYLGSHLSDLYDENLRLFIEENLYREYMENTFEDKEVIVYNNMLNKTGEYVQSNLEKYKRSFIRYIKVYIDNQEIKEDEYEQMVIELFKSLYFEDSEFYDMIFTDSYYYDELENLYDRFTYSVNNKDNKIIPLESFNNVILLGLMESVCLPKGKKIRDIFRNTLNSNKSYVKDILFDIVNFDDYYSYDFFKTNYKKIFLDSSKEEKNNLFINYYTDVLVSMKKIMKKFNSLQNLSKKEIKMIVEEYKQTIDLKC